MVTAYMYTGPVHVRGLINFVLRSGHAWLQWSAAVRQLMMRRMLHVRVLLHVRVRRVRQPLECGVCRPEIWVKD